MTFAIRVIITLLFSSVATIGLFFIDNRSNIPSIFMIPILASLLTKYVLGDWDTGFQMTFSDVAYWSSILGSSYILVRVLEGQTNLLR
jgi:hypothetical protein